MILFERTERGGVVAAGAEGSTVKRRTRGFDPSCDLAKQKPVVVPMKDHILQQAGYEGSRLQEAVAGGGYTATGSKWSGNERA